MSGGIGPDNGLVCVFSPESMTEYWWLNPCAKVLQRDGQVMLADSLPETQEDDEE